MNAVHTTDTRIAATLIGLGFQGEVHATIHAQTRETQVEVRFLAPSTRFPLLNPRQLATQWRENQFLKPMMYASGDAAPVQLPAEPMHMMAVGMRAQQSYDAFLRLQREGGSMRLEASTEPFEKMFYTYRHCDYTITGTTHQPPLTDLCLAACLGPLGIALVRLHGSHGQHSYEMADVGLSIRDSSGQWVRYRTADLVPFVGSGNDRRLEIEDVNPHHPLVISYDVLYARQELAKEIKRAKANLLITDPGGTAKQALIALDYKGHVGEAVCRHLKAPPGSLGI